MLLDSFSSLGLTLFCTHMGTYLRKASGKKIICVNCILTFLHKKNNLHFNEFTFKLICLFFMKNIHGMLVYLYQI